MLFTRTGISLIKGLQAQIGTYPHLYVLRDLGLSPKRPPITKMRSPRKKTLMRKVSKSNFAQYTKRRMRRLCIISFYRKFFINK